MEGGGGGSVYGEMPAGVGSNPIAGALSDGIEQLKQMPGAHYELLNLKHKLDTETRTCDGSYIENLFFPEFETPTPVPTKFSVATACLTSRTHAYIEPTINGDFGFVLYPKWYTMFGQDALSQLTTLSNIKPTKVNWGGAVDAVVDDGFMYTFTDNYTDEHWGLPKCIGWDKTLSIYEQVRTVACCVRIQFIGAIQTMSGILCGALTYSFQEGRENIYMVEEGYYLQHNKVDDGVRIIWLPKDEKDLEFLNKKSYGTDVLGIGDKTQAIVVYGSGLPPNYKLRVDVYRTFEGIPLTIYRELVPIKRPKHCSKTLEMLSQIQMKMTPIITVLIKDVHHVYTRLKPFFPIFNVAIDHLNIDGTGGVVSIHDGSTIHHTGGNGGHYNPHEIANFIKHLKNY